MDSGTLRHSRVPEASLVFWVTKVLTTGMGETTSDYLVHRLGPPTAVALGGIGLATGLILQFRARRYVAWTYWLAVVMVSISGTIAADVLHVQFKIPYVVSSVFFVVALAVVFVAWYASEKTLSIHSISTTRREMFYWATILTTFALGTAVGDMTATTMHLGYFSSGLLFAVLIAIPALAYWRFRLNAILAFWLAYIVTRPLGASFADWIAAPPKRGGLDVGFGLVSVVLAVVIVGFVAAQAMSGRDRTAVSERVG
jgi:uncharacterized membrane-anchored protein